MASLSVATDAYVEALAALQVLCNFFPKDLELVTLSSKWRRIPLLRVNSLTVERMLAESKPVGRAAYSAHFGRTSAEVVQTLLVLAQYLPDGRVLLPLSSLARANLLTADGRMQERLFLAHCVEFGRQPKMSSQ